MMRLLLTLALVLSASPAWAQVTFLADYSNNASADPVTVTSVNGGQSGQANRVAWILAGWRDSGGVTVNGMTYGATSATLQSGNTANGVGIRLGCVLSPAGTETVSVDFSSAPGMAWVEVWIVSGADQTCTPVNGPTYTSQGSGDTSSSITIALPSNGMILDGGYIRASVAGTLTAGSGQTDDLSDEEGAFGSTGFASHKSSAADVSWTGIAGFPTFNHVAIAIGPASGGAAAPCGLMLMGVGKCD